MLIKVEARTDGGSLLTLPLVDYSNGITVEGVDGLDPVDAVLTYSDFAQQDGTVFQAAQRDNRFITLKLGFEPNFAITTPRDLRRQLYGFFMPKSNTRLRFYEDDGLTVEIAGKVEKFISPRFTKDPDATINVTCNLPDFVDLTGVTISGNTTAGSTTTDYTYVGSSDTGFVFTINVNRTISGFTIFNTPADNTQRSLVFSYPMVAGDVVKISTVPGNKYATLTRAGVDTSVLYGVSPASDYLHLYPGVNHLRVSLAGAVIPWSAAFNTKYGGL